MTLEQRKEYIIKWLKYQLLYGQFCDNIKAVCIKRNIPIEEHWNIILTQCISYDAISAAFTWNDTPEGHVFWSKIAIKFGDSFKMTTEERFLVFRRFLEEKQCFQQFLNNYTKYKQPFRNDMNSLMNVNDPYNAISYGFAWTNTPEGHMFWRNIAEEFRDKFIV